MRPAERLFLKGTPQMLSDDFLRGFRLRMSSGRRLPSPLGAYDEAGPDSLAKRVQELLEFLQGKLSPEDLQSAAALLASDPDDPDGGTTEPPMAADSRRRRATYSSPAYADFADRFPNAARVRTI
jgi:hypothetical protein